MNTVADFFLALLLIPVSFFYTIFVSFLPRKLVHKNVKNQIVLVTGGASGFGQLLAKKFALDHGAIAVIWDVNKAGMDETAKMIKKGGGKCFSYVVDVSSRDQIYAAAKKVQAEVGKVDIVINNAGIGAETDLVNGKDELVEKMFQINILAHFWIIKQFLPAMISTGIGHVVTIASVAGLVGSGKLPGYCATKHAAVGLHESLKDQLKLKYPDAKINTTVICPYFCRTNIIKGHEHNLPPSTAFLPIRDPEPVVDEMMDAILTNQNFLIPSWGFRVIVLLLSIIPSTVLQNAMKFGDKIRKFTADKKNV